MSNSIAVHQIDFSSYDPDTEKNEYMISKIDTVSPYNFAVLGKDFLSNLNDQVNKDDPKGKTNPGGHDGPGGLVVYVPHSDILPLHKGDTVHIVLTPGATKVELNGAEVKLSDGTSKLLNHLIATCKDNLQASFVLVSL